MLFSIYALDDVFPKRDKERFRKFILAWQYICKKTILENDITIAHGLLIQFCKDFEIFYGKEKVTPNMHLHLHLKDCLYRIMNLERPQTHEQDFGALLAKMDEVGAPRGTLLETEGRNLIDIAKLSSQSCTF